MKPSANHVCARVSLCVCIGIAMFAAISCNFSRMPSYDDMKKSAEKAVTDVGGASVLGKEAADLLDMFHSGLITRTVGRGAGSEILKLHDLLAPKQRSPWIVDDRDNFPAHVVVRFGSHKRYAYVYIFDPEAMPEDTCDWLEPIDGSVFFGTQNQ